MKLLVVFAALLAVAFCGSYKSEKISQPAKPALIPLPSDTGDEGYGEENVNNEEEEEMLEELPKTKKSSKSTHGSRPISSDSGMKQSGYGEQGWNVEESNDNFEMPEELSMIKKSHGQTLPKDDTKQPADTYGSRTLPKDIQKPKSSGYGSKPTLREASAPAPRTQDTYGSRVLPDTPKKSNGYENAPRDTIKKKVKPLSPRVPAPVETFEDDTSLEIPAASCPKSNTWLSVVGCYHCEIDRCVEQCLAKNDLPASFDQCFKLTASQIEKLFTDCLAEDYNMDAGCVKLPSHMALAFLKDNYSGSRIAITPNDNCIMKCSLPKTLGCMSECKDDIKAVKNSDIMRCYRQLKPTIDSILIDFASRHADGKSHDDIGTGY